MSAEKEHSHQNSREHTLFCLNICYCTKYKCTCKILYIWWVYNKKQMGWATTSSNIWSSSKNFVWPFERKCINIPLDFSIVKRSMISEQCYHNKIVNQHSNNKGSYSYIFFTQLPHNTWNLCNFERYFYKIAC
jgi:hypothetical protein